MAYLRRVKPEPDATVAFSYENRLGVRYYLHEGKTKTGKSRYFFARAVRDGALTQVPRGFEVTESINGVVSVRREKHAEISIPLADVKLVEEAVDRHRHLRWFKVRAIGSAMHVFEPHPRPDEVRSIAEHAFFVGRIEQYVEERMAKAQYAPVMKFEMEADHYVVFRMTYRGRGGWSWPLATGKLPSLLKKFLPSVGTEKFFDLM